MRQILLAGVKAKKRAAKLSRVIADRAREHRIPLLQGVENCPLRHWGIDGQFHLTTDFSERAEMKWKNDANHSFAEFRGARKAC
jgi:hypothetical protein